MMKIVNTLGGKIDFIYFWLTICFFNIFYAVRLHATFRYHMHETWKMLEGSVVLVYLFGSNRMFQITKFKFNLPKYG